MTVSDWIRAVGPELETAAVPVATLSDRMAVVVRDALHEGHLKPGDTLGTEKDFAAALGVRRRLTAER